MGGSTDLATRAVGGVMGARAQTLCGWRPDGQRVQRAHQLAADIAATALDVAERGIAEAAAMVAVRSDDAISVPGSRVINNHEQPLAHQPRRHRLGQKLVGAGIARGNDAAHLGMAGRHNNRDVGVGVSATLRPNLTKS